MLAFIAILLFSVPVWAEPKIQAGGMYSPKVMADRILGQKKPESHCDFPGLNGSLAKYAFEASIKCEIACEGKADPVATTFTGTFNPEEQGLMPGDGHHPPSFITPSSLGSIFSAWAERECLNQAEKKCLDLSQIKHSRFISASSGDWKMEEAPSCSSKKILRSPYDSRFKLAQKAQTGLMLPSSSSHPQPLAPGTHQEPVKCSIRITGKSCFGDCVLLEIETEGKIPLTLMTDHPYATEEKSICADDLVKSFSGKNPSEAAARVLCREYFARRLLYTKSMGTSCAAFRFDADCSQVIKALTRAK
jgi:hypothetical protein